MLPPCSTEAGSYSVKSAPKHGQLSKGRAGDFGLLIADCGLRNWEPAEGWESAGQLWI